MLVNLVDRLVDGLVGVGVNDGKPIPITFLLILHSFLKLVHGFLSDFPQFLYDELSDFLHDGVQVHS